MANISKIMRGLQPGNAFYVHYGNNSNDQNWPGGLFSEGASTDKIT